MIKGAYQNRLIRSTNKIMFIALLFFVRFSKFHDPRNSRNILLLALSGSVGYINILGFKTSSNYVFMLINIKYFKTYNEQML